MPQLTLLDLRTQLRERLGEPTAAAWTDTELDNWLNEGLRDLAIRTESLQYRSEFAVPAGSYLWNFPPWDLSEHVIGDQSAVYTNPATNRPTPIRVSRVTWVDNTDDPTLGNLVTSLVAGDLLLNDYDTHREYPLQYQSLSAMDSLRGAGHQTSSGTPVAYSLWGQSGDIKIVLYPRPSTDGHLRVWFYGIPPKISLDTDIPELPAGWEHLLIDWAEYKALLRDNNPNWQAAKQEYESHVQMFTAQFKRLTIDNEPIEYDPFFWDDPYTAADLGWW